MFNDEVIIPKLSSADTHTYVVYHRADLDGKCSREIIRKWYFGHGGKAGAITAIGVDYSDNLEVVLNSMVDGSRVFLTDFSFIATGSSDPASMMKGLAGRMESVIWIDHHISAIRACEGTDWTPYPNLVRVLDSSKAACELTWDTCYPRVTIPMAVHHLGRYDIWDQKDPNTAKFQLGFNFLEGKAEMALPDAGPDVRSMTRLWNDALNRPGSVYEYSFGQDVLIVGDILETNLYTESRLSAGSIQRLILNPKDLPPDVASRLPDRLLRVAALNAQQFTSKIFDYEVDHAPEPYDVLIVYALKVSKGSPCWKMGFYSTAPDMDCSVLAESLGGGGHRGAAGVWTKALPTWLPVLPV